MSKYTTEVRYICESLSGLKYDEPFDGENGLTPVHTIDEIIQAAAPKIFSFDFPIFDENYRLALETKILRHYYTREISEETYGLWKLRLEDRLNLIMPYYNKLYDSALIEFNPLHDVDVSTTRTATDVGSTTSNRNRQDVGHSVNVVNREESSAAEDSAWRLHHDTPQGQIANIPGLTTVRSESSGEITQRTDVQSGYLTDAVHDNDVREANISANETGTADDTRGTHEDSGSAIANLHEYTDHIVGKRGTGTYSAMLQAFRETFLRIDQMVVDEFKDLFFGLW